MYIVFGSHSTKQLELSPFCTWPFSWLQLLWNRPIFRSCPISLTVFFQGCLKNSGSRSSLEDCILCHNICSIARYSPCFSGILLLGKSPWGSLFFIWLSQLRFGLEPVFLQVRGPWSYPLLPRPFPPRFSIGFHRT